jgi:hypothetical protein
VRLRRRPSAPTTQTLSEQEILIALLGDDAPVSKITILMWQSKHVRDAWLPPGTPHFWQQHEQFLLAEAARRGIARPPHGFAAERMMHDARELAARLEAQRAYRLECERHGIDPDRDPADGV